MPPPEVDLEKIAHYCDAVVPAEMRNRIKVEQRVRGNTVTILESQPADPGEVHAAWFDVGVARVKYDATTSAWTLYWFDSNSKAHRYEQLDPDQPIERIIEEIERDPTCIFWG